MRSFEKIVYLDETFEIVTGYERNVNILGLALFSGIFGAVLSNLGQRGLAMVYFFQALNEVSIKMIRMFTW